MLLRRGWFFYDVSVFSHHSLSGARDKSRPRKPMQLGEPVNRPQSVLRYRNIHSNSFGRERRRRNENGDAVSVLCVGHDSLK
jgi:hypothetical protein